MSTTRVIRFVDHGSFHRAALRMSVAGALAGLVAHVAGLLEPGLGGLASPLPLAIVGGAALHGAAPRETRARGIDLALVVLAASAAAFALTAAARGHLAPALGVALFAGALGLLFGRGAPYVGPAGRPFGSAPGGTRGASGPRLWLLIAAGAGAALVARFVLGSLAAFEPGPAWMAAALSGGAFGAVAVLGLLPRHIAVAQHARGEVDELLDRARWVLAASERAGDDVTVREAIRGEVARLDEVAGRWRELERQVASSPEPDVLSARIQELDRRIVITADAVARGQFEQAQSEVAQQLRDVESMRNARERVLARMHHSLAAIERMRTGAVGAEMDLASHALVEAEDIMHSVDGRRPDELGA